MACCPGVPVGARYMLSFVTDPAAGSDVRFTRLRSARKESPKAPIVVLPNVPVVVVVDGV